MLGSCKPDVPKVFQPDLLMWMSYATLPSLPSASGCKQPLLTAQAYRASLRALLRKA